MRRASTRQDGQAGQDREIKPTAVYYADDLPRLLRFGRDTMAREIAAGRLRVAERCGRYYFKGEWLLEWIQGGEVKRQEV